MDEIEARVLQCFANVFPALPRERLAVLDQSEVAEWDSVMHVMLLSALSEEFSLEVDYEAAATLRTFAEVVAYVREQG